MEKVLLFEENKNNQINSILTNSLIMMFDLLKFKIT